MRGRERQLLEQARNCGYLVARQNIEDKRVAGLWYRECEMERKPYVRVMPRLTRAGVLVDMVPTGGELSEAGQKAICDTVLARWGSQPLLSRCHWLVDRNSIYVPHVPIATALELAQYFVRAAIDNKAT